MKILLDHNLDWRLSRHLITHEVKSTLQMGWGALKNGALLREAENEGFAVILTADKNIRTQQRMEDRSIALIVLRARNNTLETHVSMLTEVEKVLRTIVPGQVVEVWHQSIKP